MNRLGLLILAGIDILLVIGLLFFYQAYTSAIVKGSQNTVRITTSKEPALPTGAVKISECVPHMGEHWVDPKDLPAGPLYSVYQGKIMGIEYMFEADQIPGEEQAHMTLPEFQKFMKNNKLTFADFVKQNRMSFDLFNYPYHSVTIEWSAPHAGYAKPHYDIHMYLADNNTLGTICPSATEQEAYSPEVLKTIQDRNIEFPGMPPAGDKH